MGSKFLAMAQFSKPVPKIFGFYLIFRYKNDPIFRMGSAEFSKTVPEIFKTCA